MYANTAYLNNHLPEVVDNSKPLIVTSCGNYKMKSRPCFETNRPHGRKDYQLLFIASGKAHFFIGGSERVLSAGNMVLYLPNEPQHYTYYKEDRTAVYWIHFTGSEAGSLLKYYRIIGDDRVIYVGASPDYQWLFGQIIQELQLGRPKFEELVSLHLRNIMILISRSIESRKTFSDATEKEISLAMHYFRNNYGSEINIDKYAESRNISVCWFIRCFKHITGQTPLQYLLSLRISNAQNLLENTDYTIAEVAESVGYQNALYFSRLFHKQMGISPREYRRKLSAHE